MQGEVKTLWSSELISWRDIQIAARQGPWSQGSRGQSIPWLFLTEKFLHSMGLSRFLEDIGNIVE